MQLLKYILTVGIDLLRSIALTIAVTAVIFASAWLGWALHAPQPTPIVVSQLPTIEDIQRRVGAVPDGKLGPETQAKWQRALCDQFAAENFKTAIPQRTQRSQR